MNQLPKIITAIVAILFTTTVLAQTPDSSSTDPATQDNTSSDSTIKKNQSNSQDQGDKNENKENSTGQ